MTSLEIYIQINETLSIVIWPLAILTLILIFKGMIQSLVERALDIEGRVGNFSFKLKMEKMVRQTVREVVELEKEGKVEEAKDLINFTSSVVATLTTSDIKDLIALSRGEESKRKWGKPHLVRTGFVELNGNTLTSKGKAFIERYLK